MRASRYAMLLLAVLASGAAASTPRYRLSITDHSVQKRFVVSLISLDDRPMCIELRRWPNAVGHLHYGSYYARLHTSKETYPALNENFGRCVGPSCIIHIAPHDKLTGFISYEMFGHPSVIARLPDRRLEMLISPVPCDLFPAATSTPNHAMQRTPTRYSPNIFHD